MALEVLKDTEYGNLAYDEYKSCVDRWTCDHETTTKSEDILLSKAHELVLQAVSLMLIVIVLS